MAAPGARLLLTMQHAITLTTAYATPIQYDPTAADA